MMLYRQSRAEVVIRGIRVKNSKIASFKGSPAENDVSLYLVNFNQSTLPICFC